MQRTVEVERIINATPERVFEAWTNSVELATWWGDEAAYHMTRCELDVQKPGKWVAHGAFNSTNKPFTISGEYLTIDPPFNLAFTWNESWSSGPMTMVDFTFMIDLNGTLVKVRHVGDATQEAAEQHRKGWIDILSWLKRHLEPAPAPTAVVDMDPDMDALMARFSTKLD